MSTPQSAVHPAARPHIHVGNDSCPYCGQEIPNEKAAEIKARVEREERQKTQVVTVRLTEQFARERTLYEANARAVLQQAQRETAAKIEAINAESSQRESAAREQGAQQGRAAAQQQIENLTKAQTAAQEKVAQAQREKGSAEAAKVAAQQEAKTIRESAEAVLNERLQEQRNALEKDKQTAILAEQRKTFDDKQKLQGTVLDLQRQLAKERADVLGEGAELDLFEELKAAFDGDRIRRVPKGTPGADVIHEIVEKGKVCGKIVYDSKNRNSWKNEYAAKLCEDKVAEGAQHAILSLLKFPAGAKQLDSRDGVILACPARVIAVAEILREHIVQTSSMRLSNQEREQKKGALYSYITSERFEQHLDAIESQTNKLLDIDVDEEKTHRSTWEKRGKILKGLQKTHGNLNADVGRIIGGDEAAE